MFSLMVTAFTLFAEEPVAPDAPLLLKPNVARYDYDAIPKDPLASAFFAATLPGSGQIYNKEYVRGMITGIGFYTGLFVTQYMVSRWEAQNTDTIYVEEYDKLGRWTGKYREFYAAKADKDVKGLPTDEKVVLGISATAMVGCWVFGVIDAYRGAKRYNNHLMACRSEPAIRYALTVDPAYGRVGLQALHRF
ncbi:MAG: hypothetical protein A2293_06040 [Elusimicrobia bacterium RIFOXYB2_FULL_49_7]|nr:MAG: hypothetical protein A2293_06040 [Elusimicrobia bacterium RIFOXYB2_FULL_49_7]